MLMLIKLTDAMPFLSQFTQMKKQRVNSKKFAESRVSGELKQLFEEDF